MGLKYFSRFTDVDGNGREVRFFNESFSGTPIEWINSSGAIRYIAGDSDSVFPDQPIVATQAHIGLILEELYDLSEFVFDRKTFFVQIYDLDNNRVRWSGWLEPWDAAHKYSKPPHEVSMTASCGLAHLSRKKYVNPNNSFRKTGLAIIQECISIIEADDLALRISTHMVENSFSGDAVLGLTSFEIDTQRYYDENGEAMYCDVIVNDILNHFNGEIVQWDNKWVIRAVVDHATATATDFHDIGNTTGSLAWPGTYNVNSSQAKSLDDGQIRILAPITKYRTEIDFGRQTPFFENGNLLLWNESGLIGWDFTHMPKGNPGWEQFELGGESNKSVLKINGKSPQPYRKRKKVKLFKKLTNQAINISIAATGAVGALFNKPVLKGAWEDVEPAQWIESSGGPISKADKSVTISFDYETEAFSSDVLISIRIPVTKPNGEVVNFWVDHSSVAALSGADKTHASADDKFHLIHIPPVDRGNLINRGDLNASGNPNYPAASAANWTWTITGVPSGEYRKIGGVNGINVENGDLIISRVPNVGGSQEAVGGNFEIVSIRNNIRKGTYQITVSLNTTFITSANQPFPADKVYVRFYKMADEEGRPGDWYKIYNLNGQLEGFVASTESSKYATTLERGGKTDEEAETIQLISGDFTPWYVGGWRKPGSNDMTSSWRRRPSLDESMSIYRAMMLDRLCMTSRPLYVFEGRIKLLPGEPELSYLHALSFSDQAGKRYRIVRYAFDELKRIATVTAVEILYEEIPSGELRQDSYIPGSHTLNTIPGQGDGIYPSKQDSTNGRLNAEDMPLTEEELLEVLESGSRLGVLFDEIDPLVFEVGTLSTKYRNLADYLSEVFLENEDEFEDEDTTDFAALEFSIISKPAWVSNVTKDELIFGVTGKPTAIGQFSLQIGLFDPEEPEFIIPVEIPIIVYPKTTIKYTLRDTSGLEPIGVGNIVNGSGHMKPDTWDILVQVTGHHEGWFGKVSGMGINVQPSADPYSFVSSSDTATYIIGSDIESEVGIYNLIFATYRDEGEPDNLRKVKEDKIKFSLYDEEYLAKAQFELWGAESGTLIGPIDPDGSSAFNVEEAWDVKMIIEGVEHDAGTSVLGSEVGDLDTNVIGPLDPAVEDASYFQLGEVRPEFDPSTYNVLLTLKLEGDDQYVRSATFTINKDKVKPVGGALRLVSMITNTINYDVMGTLAINGNLFTLPSSGWNVLLESSVVAGTIRKHQIFQKKGDSLININTQLYTGKSQTKSYLEAAPEDQYFIFDFLSSLDIDKIHITPSSFRVIITDEVDGVVTNIYQGDFSFGVLEDLDDLDISEPGNAGDGVQEYLAGFGLNEVIDDYVKTFNVNTDNLTIEVFSPTDPAFNWLRVKAKGITHAHYQDIASLTILGNLGGSTGSPYEVPIITSVLLAGASNLNLATSLAVKTYVDTKLTSTVTGIAGRLAKFGTTTSLTSSLIEENGINLIAREGIFVSDFLPNTNPRGLHLRAGDFQRWAIGKAGLESTGDAGSNLALWRYSDAGTFLGEALNINRATGKATFAAQVTISEATLAPLVVNSTVLVTNFNADLLDGEHGAYYRDRANHTGTQLASTISNFSAATLAVTLTGLSTTNSPITSSDTILSAFNKLQGQITGNISGTIGRYSKFATANSLTSGILSESGINVTAEGGIFVSNPTPNTNIRGFHMANGADMRFAMGKAGLESGSNSGSDFLMWRYADNGTTVLGTPLTINRATGAISLETQLTIAGSAAPLVVSSSLLVTNFNADLLDGEHGAFYRDRANHTGSQAISTVTGLQTALDSKPTGTGAANRFALWTGTNTLATSNLYYNAGNVGVGMVPGYQFDVLGSIRYTNQLASTVSTGTAPLDVTSTTLCVNLNADLLDGLHASAFALASHTHTIAQVTGLQASLDSKVINFGNGVANRFALWVDNTQIGNSNLYYNAGNIGVGMVPGYQFDVAGAIRCTSQFTSTLATGLAPIDVTSTTLCVNLHADYLNKSVIAGTGLTGGGLLTSNVTLNVAFGFTAGTAAEGDDLAALIARNITINGTAGRISSSAGAQNLSADRSWTLDLATTGVAANTYKSVTVDIYGRVTAGSNPTTLAGYGITDAYVITDVNYLLDFKATKATVLTINGIAQDLSTNRTWNVGTVTGSATAGYFPKMSSSTAITDSVMRDTGSEINVGSGRSFGVEGPAAMRDYLHVHNYVGIGKSGQHGALVIHSASSATAHSTAAIDVQSTTKGILFPRMTESQRQAIPSPPVGLMVYQTDEGDGGPGFYGAQGVDAGAAIAWVKLAFDFVDYV